MANNRIVNTKNMPQFYMQTRSPLTKELGSSISFMPNQRTNNHVLTSQQVNNYAMNKDLLSQGSQDIRGNVVGFSETLG